MRISTFRKTLALVTRGKRVQDIYRYIHIHIHIHIYIYIKIYIKLSYIEKTWILSTYNPRQNIRNKGKKSSKIGQD